MKNGSDRQIEKPLPFRDSFPVVSESPVADFLEVIEGVLSSIIHPLPDIRETELPPSVFSEDVLESSFREKEPLHNGKRISVMIILSDPFHAISSRFQ